MNPYVVAAVLLYIGVMMGLIGTAITVPASRIVAIPITVVMVVAPVLLYVAACIFVFSTMMTV